jgi:hypothetical protein
MKRVTYQIASAAVALLHLLFVLTVVFGGLAVLRWPRLIWIHLPIATWGALVELGSFRCPLTAVENALRARAGLAGYSEGFLEHYIFSIVYPDGLTRTTQIVLGCSVLLINGIVYWRLFTK